MLDWKVQKNANGNDYWIVGRTMISQAFRDNKVSYESRILGDLSESSRIVGIFYTLEEAKKSLELTEKPYEVGYYEERKWGSFEIISVGPGYVVKKLKINKDCSISYQFHEKRRESWFILKGSGNFKTEIPVSEIIHINGYMDSFKSYLSPPIGPYETITKYSEGDIIQINVKQKHKMTAIDDLEILEVWQGSDLRESDIVRLDV